MWNTVTMSMSIMHKVNLQIYVITPVYAPALSPIDVMKKRQIELLLKCYNDLSDKEKETVKHIDYAFKRDALCRPYLNPSVISSVLRQNDHKNAIFRGTITIPKESIVIDVRSVVVNNKVTIVTEEYIMPGTIITGSGTVNIIPPSQLHVNIGRMREKGMGEVIIKISMADL